MTIIPTYDTDVLGYWVAENEELLTELKIDLAPSASRCTINLQVIIENCKHFSIESTSVNNSSVQASFFLLQLQLFYFP